MPLTPFSAVHQTDLRHFHHLIACAVMFVSTSALKCPQGGAVHHQLHRLLYLYFLPGNYTGHLCHPVVSIPQCSVNMHDFNLLFNSTIFCIITIKKCILFFFCAYRSVSTIRNQRYHIHANLAFAILVAQILLLISFRFNPSTVSPSNTLSQVHLNSMILSRFDSKALRCLTQ